MRNLIAVLVGLASVASTDVALAASMPCPDGITTIDNTGSTRVYRGADPTDPNVCLHLVGKAGAHLIATRDFFGFWPGFAKWSRRPEESADLRAKIEALLTGRVESASFSQTRTMVKYFDVVQLTLSRGAADTLVVDGVPHETFKVRFTGPAAGSRIYWVDSSLHIVLKVMEDSGTGWTVTDIQASLH